MAAAMHVSCLYYMYVGNKYTYKLLNLHFLCSLYIIHHKTTITYLYTINNEEKRVIYVNLHSTATNSARIIFIIFNV